MPETDTEREQRAHELAYAAGRRDAEVDAHLRSHEKRLNAINGSIERHAQNAAHLSDSIAELGTKIDAVAGAVLTNQAVDAERVAQVKEANEKQISNRMFWLGVLAIVATLLVGFATILATHGG